MIIDDEPLAIEAMEDYIDRLDDFRIIGKCTDAVEALPLVKAGKPDLIFLDIEMPEVNGIDFIKTLNNPPRIILITAYRDYAPEAFDLDVVDYLLKPVSFPRFLRAVNRFYDTLKSEVSTTGLSTLAGDEFLNVYADGKTHKIRLDEILFFESMSDYVVIHFKYHKIITRERISALEKKLPEDLFLRIHRSFIVSLKQVVSFTRVSLEICGISLPVSRTYRDGCLRRMNAGRSG